MPVRYGRVILRSTLKRRLRPPLFSAGFDRLWQCHVHFLERGYSGPLRVNDRDGSRLSAGLPTIYALSTAQGRAAIAVIRISGPACLEIYHALCPGKPVPKPRVATLRTLYDPSLQRTRDSVLDSGALVLHFPAPNTVTGEDVLELHVHGGVAVVQAVLKAISRCQSTAGSIRYAEAGEFTWRGFLNGRSDLVQVEALGDVLSANTEQQRKLSVRGTTGRLAEQYEHWRSLLLHARGELEALIDFQEDQHFDESPAMLAASVATQVEHLIRHIDTHISNAMRGELLRNGIRVALLGAPNAGKSSLLNCIVGREAAIVSTEAGTTRDVVEVGVDIGGFLCQLGDMAGLRSNTPADDKHDLQRIGAVEAEGIRRAKERAMSSDVVLVIASVELDGAGKPFLALDADVISSAQMCAESGAELIMVVNKVDHSSNTDDGLRKPWENTIERAIQIPSDRIFAISCKRASSAEGHDTGNIQGLLSGLTSVFDQMTTALSPQNSDGDDSAYTVTDRSVWQESLGASERHRSLLEECQHHLKAFVSQVDTKGTTDSEPSGKADEIDVVLAAESLREAASCLAKITGRGGAGDVEEVLGVVFSKFCVGK